MNNIHRTAIIGNVKIGNNNTIEENVIIRDNVTLGDGNIIRAGTILGSEPSITAPYPNGILEIGDNNLIQSHVIISKGTYKHTKLGNNNIIYENVYIGHDCQIGNNNLFVNSTNIASESMIGNNCTIYACCRIYNNVLVGDNCIIGANTDVTKNVIPYSEITSKRTNKVIVPRNKDLNNIFKIIYRSGLTLQEAITKLKELPTNDKLETIIDFLQYQQNGISR